MRDPKIAEEFDDQKSMPLYGFIENNRFKPFGISTDVLAGYQKLSEEKGIPNPLDKEVLKILNKIQDKLFEDQQLNKPFVIKEEDYLLPEPGRTSSIPLPETPMPDASVVASNQAPANTMKTGLTVTEQALLSEEEKMMTLKNRGLA